MTRSLAQYRVANAVRERYCTACAKWKPHDREHFYAHASKPHGLQTTCAACQLAATKVAIKRKRAYQTQMRQYAKRFAA